MGCFVKGSAHLLGKKWTVEIVEEMALGKFDGFNSFLRKTKGLTPRTLSQELKALESAGVVRKTSTVSNNQTSTRYALTKKGRELHGAITEIKKWNVKWNKTPAVCLSIPCSECSQSLAGGKHK
jgi:DNA-binding HxlR family transcriptional regulator